MCGRRLLLVSRQLLTRNVLPLKKNVGESARESHIVCIPPRNKTSFAEQIFMGVAITLSMWAVPVWIMYHIPEYQKEDRHTYTGK